MIITSTVLSAAACSSGGEAGAGGGDPSEPRSQGGGDTTGASSTEGEAAPLTVASSPYTECPPGRFCSSLYPPTWSADAPADAAGRYLHDFSFAGYRYGERPPTSPPGATFDVAAQFGADGTGAVDATRAIQAAIDAASTAGGGIVFFPAGTYRVDGDLTVRASGVVLRGTGASSVLHFAKVRGKSNKAQLELRGAVSREATRALVADAPARAKELSVADATGLAPGDEVAVGWTITEAFVAEHGMSGTWSEQQGQHVPFFRNRIASVDTSSSPHKVVLEVPLRYPAKVRDGASIQREAGYLREVGLEHLGITDAVSWADAWAENLVYAVIFRGVMDAWVDDVHSVPPPGSTDPDAHHLRNSGLKIEDAKRVSVLRTSLENPQNRGDGGNGYLFEVSQTSEVLFADCEARNGRHNFIQNWGFGNSGTVFLRCTSSGSHLAKVTGELTPAFSEHHHSLGIATLVDDCHVDDGFSFVNRGDMSVGAGHTATESVVWGAHGSGKLVSRQYGWGYVIGNHAEVDVQTSMEGSDAVGTSPEDFVEGRGMGAALYPSSLYEDQRARRLTSK